MTPNLRPIIEPFFQEATGTYPTNGVTISHEDNNMFSRFLKIDIHEGECIVPTFHLTDTLITLRAEYLGSSVDNAHIIYPLWIGGQGKERTADNILSTIGKCTPHLRLTQVIGRNGLTYYGGSGIILNKDFAPMMLCGYIFNINKATSSIVIKEPVCCVSPIVFHEKDLISKTIVKKILPYINDVELPTSINLISSEPEINIRKNIKVIIEKLQNYFIKPTEPTDIDSMDADIWDFITEHINGLT